MPSCLCRTILSGFGLWCKTCKVLAGGLIYTNKADCNRSPPDTLNGRDPAIAMIQVESSPWQIRTLKLYFRGACVLRAAPLD